MRFTKMHGAGNDYIYVDCFAQPVPNDLTELARAISDRHFGVGGDGLILICHSGVADAEMRMFNVDGSPSEMCGNGIRCVAKYVFDHGICRRDKLRIASAGRVLSLDLDVENNEVHRVRVDMGEPILNATQIPTKLPGNPPLDVPLALGDRKLLVTCLSMSNPHCVSFVDGLSDDLVLGLGPRSEHAPEFPNRTNVEFAQVLSPDRIRQRTWERGSGETLACGTGACAVCVAGVLTKRCERRVTIELLGGELEIEWNHDDNHVYMTGAAVEVFTGDWPV
jgi:diaminopimelate epimerase